MFGDPFPMAIVLLQYFLNYMLINKIEVHAKNFGDIKLVI